MPFTGVPLDRSLFGEPLDLTHPPGYGMYNPGYGPKYITPVIPPERGPPYQLDPGISGPPAGPGGAGPFVQQASYVGTPRYTRNDAYTIASILQGESPTPEGMQAVASVMANRAAQGGFGGNDIMSVALAKNQFQGQAPPSPQALEIAQTLLAGNLPDNTGGATFYANPSNSSAPWARNLNDSNAINIGGNYFTNNPNGVPFTPNPAPMSASQQATAFSTGGLAPPAPLPVTASYTGSPAPTPLTPAASAATSLATGQPLSPYVSPGFASGAGGGVMPSMAPSIPSSIIRASINQNPYSTAMPPPAVSPPSGYTYPFVPSSNTGLDINAPVTDTQAVGVTDTIMPNEPIPPAVPTPTPTPSVYSGFTPGDPFAGAVATGALQIPTGPSPPVVLPQSPVPVAATVPPGGGVSSANVPPPGSSASMPGAFPTMPHPTSVLGTIANAVFGPGGLFSGGGFGGGNNAFNGFSGPPGGSSFAGGIFGNSNGMNDFNGSPGGVFGSGHGGGGFG